MRPHELVSTFRELTFASSILDFPYDEQVNTCEYMAPPLLPDADSVKETVLYCCVSLGD